MWTGKRWAGSRECYEPWVERGVVTQNQDVTGVYLDGERRQLAMASPGGYQWMPNVGEDVLVLKENQGDGAQHIVGSCQTGVGDLSPGDVVISSGGNASVQLLGEDMVLLGQIWVENMSLEDYIKKVVGGLT